MYIKLNALNNCFKYNHIWQSKQGLLLLEKFKYIQQQYNYENEFNALNHLTELKIVFSYLEKELKAIMMKFKLDKLTVSDLM